MTSIETTGVRLELRRVFKTFTRITGHNLEVLRDISLAARPSEFVTIVGASGCGKTTLLRIVDGLIPASSGDVLIDEQVVTGPGPDRAMVFQSDCLLPWRTVLENVIFGPELRGRIGADTLVTARRLLQMTGLEGFERAYPRELSGGMRQRVNLARALAVAPRVLLMDEPFASLDAQTRELMQAELSSICQQTGQTVLFITHQIEEAVYLADRVIVLTARPGRMREVIEVDLPRPRPLEVKRTPRFLDYVSRIWHLIEDEVRASMATRIES